MCASARLAGPGLETQSLLSVVCRALTLARSSLARSLAPLQRGREGAGGSLGGGASGASYTHTHTHTPEERVARRPRTLPGSGGVPFRGDRLPGPRRTAGGHASAAHVANKNERRGAARSRGPGAADREVRAQASAARSREIVVEDASAQASMKSAASCETSCDTQDLVNHRILERPTPAAWGQPRAVGTADSASARCRHCPRQTAFSGQTSSGGAVPARSRGVRAEASLSQQGRPRLDAPSLPPPLARGRGRRTGVGP